MEKKNQLQIDQLRRYEDLLTKQTGRIVRPYRADGFVNLLTNYGTQKDSSEHYQYVPDPIVPDDILIERYESNGLFAKIIDAPAEEAVSNGFVLKDLKDDVLEKFYQDALDELDWEETAITAFRRCDCCAFDK